MKFSIQISVAYKLLLIKRTKCSLNGHNGLHGLNDLNGLNGFDGLDVLVELDEADVRDGLEIHNYPCDRDLRYLEPRCLNGCLIDCLLKQLLR